jgi:hypothetical protein
MIQQEQRSNANQKEKKKIEKTKQTRNDDRMNVKEPR